MTSNIRIAIMVTGATAALCALMLWRADATIRPSVHARLASDRSESRPLTCGAEQRLAGEILTLVGGAPGSTFAFYTVGSADTANEPARLDVDLPAPGLPPRVLSGRRRRGDAAAPPAFVTQVREACEGAAPTSSSPIYLAIKRLVEDVANAGEPASPRFVFLHSDLQETADRAIRTALRQPLGAPLSGLPPKIDNEGVEVRLCGYAATVGRRISANGRSTTLTRPRRADSSDRLEEVWLRLFTHPDQVVIQPFCQAKDKAHAN